MNAHRPDRAGTSAIEGYDRLLFRREAGGVLVVTMNRPEVLNAMDHMHAEVARVWADIARDEETRAVVLTGAGRAFSAGGDRKLAVPPPDLRLRTVEQAIRLVRGMLALDRPIVSAINGPAVGAGLALALMADVSIAASDAVLVDGHTRMGLVAGEHALLIWPLLCGLAKAKYHLLTDEPMPGDMAARIGLVSQAVPQREVLPRALLIARRLAADPGHARRRTRRVLDHWLARAVPIYEHSWVLEARQYVAEGRPNWG